MAKSKMLDLKQDQEIKIFEGKIPPHSKDMEIGVIGSLIMDNRLIDELISILQPKHFYSMHNSMIYRAIIELRDRNEPVDLLTLTEELRIRSELEAVGGPAYLSQVIEFIGTKESIVSWANTIVDHWIRRELILLTYYLTEQSFDVSNHTQSLLDSAQQKIFEVTGYFQKKNYTNIQDEVRDTMEYVETIHERHEKGATVFGVPTGYDELDALTGGFQKSELIIIAGRPSHGKTALALNFARNAAVDHGKNIGIFSIEMSNRELALRFICLESKVDIAKLKTGRLPESDWAKIAKQTPRLMSSKINVIIDDSSPLSLLELRSKARRMKALQNIDMVMIDYLQLMEVSNKGNLDRHLEIAYITRGLKQLAKELDIPVVALSQLSRKVEERAGKEKRPQLSDLRESGAIEQDADVVIFINRPDIYISKDDPKFHEVQGLAEVIVGKQRNGPIGEAKLTFIHNYAMFANRAKDAEPSYYAPQDAPF
ncbi:MAG: replicative DNA helicase [Ignavibacteria bacterium]|nr:replicative DNA helicase [Ignavibacteria bacterium]